MHLVTRTDYRPLRALANATRISSGTPPAAGTPGRARCFESPLWHWIPCSTGAGRLLHAHVRPPTATVVRLTDRCVDAHRGSSRDLGVPDARKFTGAASRMSDSQLGIFVRSRRWRGPSSRSGVRTGTPGHARDTPPLPRRYAVIPAEDSTRAPRGRCPRTSPAHEMQGPGAPLACSSVGLTARARVPRIRLRRPCWPERG